MPAMPFAIVVIGVAGSGKTTIARALARHYGAVFLDADDVHSAAARTQMAAGVPLTDSQRDPWVLRLQQALREFASQGRSSVLAFSGLRAAHRQVLRASGVPTRFVFLHAPPAVIAARLAGRSGHFMPPGLLPSQLEALQSPLAEADVVTVDASGPPQQVLAAAITALEASGAGVS